MYASLHCGCIQYSALKVLIKPPWIYLKGMSFSQLLQPKLIKRNQIISFHFIYDAPSYKKKAIDLNCDEMKIKDIVMMVYSTSFTSL